MTCASPHRGVPLGAAGAKFEGGGAVPHFFLEESDAETCEEEEGSDGRELKPENSEDSQSSTWGHSPNEDLRWPRCPAFDLSLSDTEQDPQDWTHLLEILEIQDQYKFDPEVVATMVDQGSGLEDLSEHLCEVMANGLEEHAEDKVSANGHDMASSEVTPTRRRLWRPETTWLRAAERPKNRAPTEAASQGNRRGLLARLLGARPPSHQAMLRATRQSLLARRGTAEDEEHQEQQEHTEVGEKLKLVEATRPTTPAQSVREGRIEEAVSAACMTSQIAERFVSAKSRKNTRQVNRAIRHSQEVKPLNIDYPAGDGKKWIVVGGKGTGGLVVRTGQSLKSKALGVRLEFGAWLEELALKGNRLHFRRLRGDGPDFGWVSTGLAGERALVSPLDAKGAASLPAVRHPCLQDNMAELMMPPKARAALTEGS
ncbi:hypothetical protein AK812_SmicGene574 [Symbiodinium microadriaticum]|uniref:Uncharacterized protein n=1 Tax=Symbiodinium microadriaticum TaxID=2951 RepID=A0A1Q9F683_SYMMI|nr:hypothetical protein AK812_SmicGene574 [Symbiodinium microadriaticum]